MLEVGQTVPDFSFKATSGLNAKLDDYQGKKIILYFYPKDNTPGCTAEGQDFTALYNLFKKANAVVFGVSKDSMKAHENFKAKYQFPFELISDKDQSLCQLFDVIKEKSMFGKKYMGIERSTFLIDEQGKLVKEWRKIKIKGHAETVLKEVMQPASGK